MKLEELKFPEKLDMSFIEAVTDFAERHGSKIFQGGQAVVIDRNNFVWRVWTDDRGYDMFIDFAQTSTSTHLPKMFGKVRTADTEFKFMRKDKKLRYIKLEKLSPLEPGMLSDAINAIGMQTIVFKPNDWPITAEELSERILSFKFIDSNNAIKIQSVILNNKSFFELVLELLRKGANDISAENVMMRGSVPVITDPFKY